MIVLEVAKPITMVLAIEVRHLPTNPKKNEKKRRSLKVNAS